MIEIKKITKCSFCGKEHKTFLYTKEGERIKKQVKRRPERSVWRARGATFDMFYNRWFCNACIKKLKTDELLHSTYKSVTKKKLNKESERKKNGNTKNRISKTRNRQKKS